MAYPKTYKTDKGVYEIPEKESASFLKDFPNAMEVVSYKMGKDTFDIPVKETEVFIKENPQAVPLKKKEPSDNGLQEPSDGGLDGTIPTITQDDVIGKIQEADALSKKTRFWGMGGGGGEVPDFDAIAKSKEIHNQLKGMGYGDNDIEILTKTFSDLPKEAEQRSVKQQDGTVAYPYSKKSFLELYKSNPIAAVTKANNVKNFYELRNAAGEGKASEYNSLAYVNDETKPINVNIDNFNQLKERQKELINTSLPKEKKQKALDRVEENSDIILSDIFKDEDNAKNYLIGKLQQKDATLKLSNPTVMEAEGKVDGDLSRFSLESIAENLDPKNKAENLAFRKYKYTVDLDNAINSSADLNQAAVTFAAEQNPQIKGQIEKLDGTRLPNAYEGEIVNQFLNSPDVIKRAEQDPEFAAKYNQAKNNLYFNYPEFAKKEVATKISQAMEDRGMTNWFANIPTKEGTDKLVDDLVRTGKLTEQDKLVYDKQIRDDLGVWQSVKRGVGRIPFGAFIEESPIQTPGLLESTQNAFNKTIHGVARSVEDVINIPAGGEAFSAKERLYNKLQEDASLVNLIPKSTLHEVSMGTGHLAGFVIPMMAGGAALRGVKGAEFISNGLIFEGENKSNALKLFPDNPTKQYAYTAIATAGDMMLGHLIPKGDAAKGISKTLKGDIVDVVNKFTNKEITAAQAKQTLLNKTTSLLGDLAKENTKVAGTITGFGVFHNTLDALFGANNMSAGDISTQAVKDFKSTFLTTPVLAAMAVKGRASGINGKVLMEVASNPELYKKVIAEQSALNPELKSTEKERLQNLEDAALIKKDLDNTEMNDKQKEEFMVTAINKKILERKAAGITDKTLKQSVLDQAEKHDTNLVLLKSEFGDKEFKDLTPEERDRIEPPKNHTVKTQPSGTEGKFTPVIINKKGEHEVLNKSFDTPEAAKVYGEETVKKRYFDENIKNKEEELPDLSQPIEGTNEKGIPIGENVPPEVKGEPEKITQPIELSVEGKPTDVVVDEGVGKIKSSWESNIEALVHPETGLAAVTQKILDKQQPLKDAFLKRIGLTIEDYRKLDDTAKEKIQQQWIKSKEFEELGKSESLSTPKAEPQQSGKDVVVDYEKLSDSDKDKHIKENTGLRSKDDFEKVRNKIKSLIDGGVSKEGVLKEFNEGYFNSIKGNESRINEYYNSTLKKLGIDEGVVVKDKMDAKFYSEEEIKAHSDNLDKQYNDMVEPIYQKYRDMGIPENKILQNKDAYKEIIEATKQNQVEENRLKNHNEQLARKIVNDAVDKQNIPDGIKETIKKFFASDSNSPFNITTKNAKEFFNPKGVERLAETMSIREAQGQGFDYNDMPSNAKAELFNKNLEIAKIITKDIGNKVAKGYEQSLSTKPEIKNEEPQVKIPIPKEEGGITETKTGQGVPETETGKGKFEEKARKLAEKIMATDIVPDWLKIDDPNVKKSGADAETIKKALADAAIKMGKLLDKGVEFGEAVKEAVKDLVDLMGEGMRGKIEDGFAKDYKGKLNDLSGIKKGLVSDKIIEGVDLERVGDKEMMSLGRKILDTGEVKPEALVTKIITDGKGVLTPTEVVGLITYKRDIDNALQDTYKKLAEKKANGEDVGTLAVEAKNLERQQNDFDVMAVITAQQQSMAFRLRQRMLDREYNVVTQIERYKASNDGKIPADVEAKFRDLDKQLKEVKVKLEKAEKDLAEKEGQDAVNNIKESVDRERTFTDEQLEKKIQEGVESEISKLYEQLPAEKKSAADKAISALEKFRAKIKTKTYESTLGIPMAIADLGAATAIRAIKVGKTVAEAVRIGIDRIKKELEKSGIKKWEGEAEYIKDLTETLESEGVSTKKQPKDKPTINEDGTVSIPNEMLRDLVKRGVTDINDLVSEVYKEIKKDLPNITERQVRDYITDYGKKVNPTADEIQTQVNTAKRVGRLLSELEDVQNKIKKQKGSTGNKLTDKERELKRKINTLSKDIFGKEEKSSEQRLSEAKERIRQRISDLTAKIKNKDFAKPVKKLPVTDTELVKLNSEKERLQDEFDKEQYALELNNRTVWQKWEDRAYELTSGLMRGLTLGVDLSAMGVQGMRRLFTNPTASAKAFWHGLKFLVSEKGANEFMDKQKAQPYYPLLRAVKLAIDDKTGKQSVKEGMFVSEWINYIWNKGISPVVGLGTNWGTNFVRKINPYAASQRAYDGYVNSIRIQTYLKLAKELSRDGYTYEADTKVFDKLADFVNTTTGRGSLGAADANSRWLNVFLTAPRKVISEVKLYTPYAFVYYARMPKQVRMKALKDFAQFTGTFMAVNALVWASRKDWGDEEEDKNDNFWNMNSSDFLTHKIGNKRISIGGGMKSILTMQSRLFTGEFTDQYGNTSKLGDRYGKPINTRLDLVTRFAIGKAAPAFNVLSKKLDERAGRPVEDAEIIKSLSVPLWIQDVGELYKNDPNSVAPLLMAFSILGANVRAVEKSKSQEANDELSKEPIFKEFIDKEINFPELNPEKIQTKEVNNKVTEKLSDYDQATQDLFIKKKKEYLKIELNKLKNNSIKVYVDKDGNATTTKDKDNSFKSFDKLTKEQIQNVISSSISGNVTEKVKKEVLKGKTPLPKKD